MAKRKEEKLVVHQRMEKMLLISMKRNLKLTIKVISMIKQKWKWLRILAKKINKNKKKNLTQNFYQKQRLNQTVLKLQELEVWVDTTKN